MPREVVSPASEALCVRGFVRDVIALSRSWPLIEYRVFPLFTPPPSFSSRSLSPRRRLFFSYSLLHSLFPLSFPRLFSFPLSSFLSFFLFVLVEHGFGPLLI